MSIDHQPIARTPTRRWVAVLSSVTAGPIVVILLWHAALHVAVGFVKPSGGGLTVAALAWAPLALFPAWAVWQGLRLIHRGHLEAASMKKGAAMLAAQLGAVGARLLLFAAVLAASGVWLFQRSVGTAELADALPIPAVDWFAQMGAVLLLTFLLGTLALTALVQLAYAFSHMADGYRRLILFWTCLLLAWITLRAVPLAADALRWLPAITYKQMVDAGELSRFATMAVESGPYAAVLLLAVAAFFAASWGLPLARERSMNPPAKTYADAPAPERHPVTTRDKALIALMAISFLTLLDIGFNGRTIVKDAGNQFWRPVDAASAASLESLFLVRTGSISQPGASVQSLRVATRGAIEVVPSTSGDLIVHYSLWSSGLSVPDAVGRAEGAEVRLDLDGGDAQLVASARSSSVHAGYRIELPAGVTLRVKSDGGDVRIHRVEADVDLGWSGGIIQVSDVRGHVAASGSGGHLFLSNLTGDARVTHRDGVAEIHGVRGGLILEGDYLTASVSNVTDGVDASLRRGIGRFAHLSRQLDVRARATAVTIGAVEGPVTFEGTASPVRFAPLQSAAEIKSDRGHVRLRLADNVDWRLEVKADGAVHSSLPWAERADRRSPLTGAVQSGTSPVQVDARGADVWVEAHP